MYQFFSNKRYLPLFWKFSIAITIVVIIFGTINYSLIRNNITNTLENELKHRLNFIVNTLAEQLSNSVLISDFLSIQTIINTAKINDSSIKFILLVDNTEQVIAHSFDQSLPENIKENYQCTDSCYFDEDLPNICSNNKLGVIQASRPILDGNLGYLYIGVDNKNINAEVNQSMKIFLVMILTFLIIGIGGAFIFSYLITKPIKSLKEFSKNLSLNNLTQKNLEIFDEIIQANILMKKVIVTDEIDNLIETFKEMLIRLTYAHNELQNLQSQLMHTEKLSTIGVLAAGLAHDINNPIAGVLNSIHRIKKNPTNIEQVTRYLDLMEESAKKIQIVIANLMNFARKQDIEFSSVNLIDIIEKSLLLVSHKLNESNIKVLKKYDKTYYELVGSQHHLEQVFINLLINSIDAINKKASLDVNYQNKQIKITINEIDNTFWVTIVDNGIGIEEDKIQYIFQTFYTTKNNEGTGLGLSIVQNILNLHKAKIEFQSEFEKWTKVTLIFKRYLDDEQTKNLHSRG